MRVLIFGPSGSGKTYLANAFQKLGIVAYDDEDIKDLSSWYDKGNKVQPPKTAAEALTNRYSFVCSKRF